MKSWDNRICTDWNFETLLNVHSRVRQFQNNEWTVKSRFEMSRGDRFGEAASFLQKTWEENEMHVILDVSTLLTVRNLFMGFWGLEIVFTSLLKYQNDTKLHSIFTISENQ